MGRLAGSIRVRGLNTKLIAFGVAAFPMLIAKMAAARVAPDGGEGPPDGRRVFRGFGMKKGLLAALLLVPFLARPALGDGEQTPLFNLWGEFSYQSWLLHGQPIPVPLATTGPLPGGGLSPQFGSGIPGAPGTEEVLGGGNLGQSLLQGGKLTLGAWLDYPCETWAVETSFFYLSPSSQTDIVGSNSLGQPLLARPVTDAGTHLQTVEYISAPGAFAGNLGVTSTSSLWGGEANLLYVANRWEEGGYFNLLGGFRFLQLRETLDIAQTTQVLPGGIAFFDAYPEIVGSGLQLNDNFRTRNDFYGPQMGAQLGYTWWRFNASLAGKVAMGAVHQIVDIYGATTVSSPLLSKPESNTGGLLALPNTIGSYHRNVFAVLPTVEANLSFELTSQIHLLVGYTLLYLNDVARPGDQINPTVNRELLPTSQIYNPSLAGPTRSQFAIHSTDFWAQGFTFGISFWF
jgi:hypothetical protein